ncbi:MAG: hypothetical protein K5985_01985 [Lachnospiraceae bacterium]|nr:hypothetical protein [Lachnospiraceae bacterium]
MKRNIKEALKIILFLLCVFFLVLIISKLTLRKTSREKMTLFFERAEDLDVIFAGISHTQSGVYPLELWENYGITSYNLASAGMRMQTNYWNLLNALSFSSPKLIVLDTDYMDYEVSDGPKLSELTRENFDAYPLSRIKLETAADLIDDPREKAGFLFPLIRYHSRWKELTMRDFGALEINVDNGAAHDPIEEMGVSEPEIPPLLPESEMTDCGEISVEYLEKIISLCKERGIDLLLVYPPAPVGEEKQRLANAVKPIADEAGVDYLNFLHIDCGVDYDVDMKDLNGHLNEAGARKYTSYLGKYIKEHYDIPDHRNDTGAGETSLSPGRLAIWNDALSAYPTYKAGRIVKQPYLDIYCSMLSDDDFNPVIFFPEDSPILKDQRFQRLLKNIVPDEEKDVFDGIGEKALSENGYLFIADRESTPRLKLVPLPSSGEEELSLSFGTVLFGRDENGRPDLRFPGENENRLGDGLDSNSNPWGAATFVFDARTKELVHNGFFTVLEPEKPGPINAMKY